MVFPQCKWIVFNDLLGKQQLFTISGIFCRHQSLWVPDLCFCKDGREQVINGWMEWQWNVSNCRLQTWILANISHGLTCRHVLIDLLLDTTQWAQVHLLNVFKHWLPTLSKPYYLIIFDSVFGKRVLTYWKNRGISDYSQMNGLMEGIENYIFLERGKPHLSKNV